MALAKDPLRLMIHVVVYVVLFLVTATVAGWALNGLLNSYPVSNVATFLFSAVVANWLALRIYSNRRLIDAGLWLNRASGENLLAGLAGSAGATCLVLAPPARHCSFVDTFQVLLADWGTLVQRLTLR